MTESPTEHPVENSAEQPDTIESASGRAKDEVAQEAVATGKGHPSDVDEAGDEQLNSPTAADTDSGAVSASGDHGQADIDNPGE